MKERIAVACARAGRRDGDVRLIAVSKTVAPERIREAREAGLREFGENRVQEAAAKIEQLAGLDLRWHLIGHLQSNKARRAASLFGWIHSVDSIELAAKLNAAVGEHENRLPVLLQVNLGGESAKSGVEETNAVHAAQEISGFPRLELRGLMLIPPYREDPEDSRPFFRRLRTLAKEIHAAGMPAASVHELSMGMSHDFEVAIEEGATMIRVGTAIFGGR